jgi:hypothetical protein
VAEPKFEPLRWYEDLALFFLSHSPRIASITVKLPIIEPKPEPEPEESLAHPAEVYFLEDIWNMPDPPSDTRHG